MTTVIDQSVDTMIGALRFIWLEITSKCNLTCSHCYAESGPEREVYGNMAYHNWVRVLDESADLNCRRVQFIGGEPTMHPQLSDLIDHATHLGFEFIEVYTNATRLGKNLIECFRRNRVHVATSFYSIDPLVHDRITQGKGSWERTVSGIRAVVAAHLPIRVGIVETEQNLGHGEQVIKFVKRLGVENVGIDRQRGVGRGGLLQLECEEERYDELCGQCWKGNLCVTPSGEVFPCVFSRATRLGDVKAGLSRILNSVKLSQFREKVRGLESNQRDPVFHGERCDPCRPCGPCPPQCNPDHCNPCSPYRCFPADE
jgi:MoaA/NifB/PqqE/SkfB family radical SAM enzyme